MFNNEVGNSFIPPYPHCINSDTKICICNALKLLKESNSESKPLFYVDKGRYEKHVFTHLTNKGWKSLIYCSRSEKKRNIEWTTSTILPLCKIYWIRNRAGYPWKQSRLYNLYWNHIVNEFVLTKKHHLAKHLKLYIESQSEKGVEINLFHPLTYNLDLPNEKDEFINKLNESSETNNPKKWIVKPVDASGGKGIRVIDTLSSFFKEYVVDEDQKRDISEIKSCTLVRSLIAQSYIDNPLLLNGYKFDIRSYMFIASVDPMIVFFHDGYLRVNIEKYESNNLNNIWSHISNIGLQKLHPDYEQKKLESKWSLKTWTNFMLKEKMVDNENFYAEKIRPQFCYIVKHSFLSVVDKLKLYSDKSSFALLGIDFLIDTNYKAWLLEYTKTPAGHSTLEKDDTLFFDMMCELLDIMIEIDDKRSKNLPLDHLESVKDFVRVI